MKVLLALCQTGLLFPMRILQTYQLFYFSKYPPLGSTCEGEWLESPVGCSGPLSAETENEWPLPPFPKSKYLVFGRNLCNHWWLLVKEKALKYSRDSKALSSTVEKKKKKDGKEREKDPTGTWGRSQIPAPGSTAFNTLDFFSHVGRWKEI